MVITIITTTKAKAKAKARANQKMVAVISFTIISFVVITTKSY